MTVAPHTTQARPEPPTKAVVAHSPFAGLSGLANGPGRVSIQYTLFLVGASLYLIPFMRLLLKVPPEGTLVDGAARIVRGQVFARDFFEVVGPGTFYWVALFFKLFGVSFVAERICLFVTSLLTGLAVYYLSRRICTRYQVLPSVLLAGTYFGMLWPTISHHVDSNCFALLSVVCITVWLHRQKAWALTATGALAGITTFTLQPKGILLMLGFLLWLWLQRRRLLGFRLNMMALLGGYIGVTAFVLLYFWNQGALSDLAYANVTWPSRNYSAANAVPYAHNMIRGYWDQWIIWKVGFRWTAAMASVLILPFALIATLPVLLPALGARFAAKEIHPEVALYWICGSAMWLSEIHRKDISHLVFGSPLLIIILVYYLNQYRSKIADWALQLIAISATCLAGFNFVLALSAHSVTTRVGSVAMLRSDPVLASLIGRVHPGEEIFAYPYCPMYYFLSETSNPTRFSLLMYNYNTASQFREVTQVLERRQVKYVVWDKQFQKTTAPAIAPNSPPVQDAELIVEPYIISHYRVVTEANGIAILERKSNAGD